jgi:spoIIIJ-associated protein
MNTLEITAATVDQAVAEAAKKLGVDSADIDVEVLEETQGLFGKGKVRIRATAKKQAAPAAKAVVEPVKQEPEPEPAEAAPEAVEAEAPKPERPARERRERTPRPKKEAAPAEPKADGEAEKEAEPEVVATQEDADELVAILGELLELADLDAKPEVVDLSGRYVTVRLDGRDVSFLVGRRGEVINALQYLMNVMSTRKLHNGVRVVLEGNDYRKKRQDVLTTLALQIAEEVAKRGEEAVLDALPAFERRVVHKALSEFPGVVTYSEGEEPNRRVVIAPGS